jgi:hypothetical protein
LPGYTDLSHIGAKILTSAFIRVHLRPSAVTIIAVLVGKVKDDAPVPAVEKHG